MKKLTYFSLLVLAVSLSYFSVAFGQVISGPSSGTSTANATATEDAPTYTEGATGSLSVDLSGNLRTTLGTTSAGEAVADDVIKVEQRGYYTTITTATSTTLKTGPGWFQGCTILGGVPGNITIYDNTSAASPVMINTFTPVTGDELKNINMNFSVGAFVVTAAATNMTCIVR